MRLEDHEFKDYLTHFPEGISLDIRRFATEDIYKTSRYIFTKRQGKQQYGYCTHCKKEFKTSGLQHNKAAICPECKSECIVKASGRGRKRMIDEAYFVYYEKSVKNPSVIVARGIYAVRDYSDDYHDVETCYIVRAWYIFEMGNSVMIERPCYYSQAKTMQSYSSYLCKSVYSLYSRYFSNLNAVIGCSDESIEEAVKETLFRWSGWESYKGDDMVKFFALYAKYPCVEYLTKLGFQEFVEQKLSGENTYGAINWRGETPLKILRLSKNDFKEIKASFKTHDPLVLRLYQISKKDHSRLTLEQLFSIKKNYGSYFKDLQKVLKYTTLRKADSYMTKQYESIRKGGRYYSTSGVLTTWKDYIADCIMLEMNLADERVLFPKDLYEAHQSTTKRIKTDENGLLDSKIKRRLGSLQQYCFEYSGLFIRPLVSTKEIIAEGKTLVHCVGNYANGYMTKYASGKTNLFVIRKITEPDTPYYTVELRKNSIIQVRGFKDNSPNKSVSEFIEAYTSQVLNKNKSKNKALLTA